jgi:hypothetical protein
MSENYEYQEYNTYTSNPDPKFIRPPVLTRSNYACPQTDYITPGPTAFRFPLSLVHPDDISPNQIIMPRPEWADGSYIQYMHRTGANAYQVYSDEDTDDDIGVTIRPETPVLPAKQAVCTTFTLPNGEVRTGYSVYNNIYWLGECKYADGSTYSGDWMNGKRHGLGKIVETNGYMYYGWWEDDMRHGQGEASYPDGSMFDGDWKYDKKYGFGKITRPDGTSYEGEWINDKLV